MNLPQALREHILSQYFKGHAPEGFDDNFNLIDEGVLDSLAIINLTVWLEKNGQIDFGDHDIVPEHFNSINAMLEFVRKKRG
jgi:acyl carrier protein